MVTQLIVMQQYWVQTRTLTCPRETLTFPWWVAVWNGIVLWANRPSYCTQNRQNPKKSNDKCNDSYCRLCGKNMNFSKLSYAAVHL